MPTKPLGKYLVLGFCTHMAHPWENRLGKEVHSGPGIGLNIQGLEYQEHGLDGGVCELGGRGVLWDMFP